MTTPEPPDPTRHLLVHLQRRRLPDGTTEASPIGLDEIVAEYRSSLALSAAAESRLGPSARELVVVAPGRAAIIAELLDELALRLRPGTAVGPIRSDGSLSRLVRELADDMYRRAQP
jgi:hypothetical protein